jgi:hypothetical protein
MLHSGPAAPLIVSPTQVWEQLPTELKLCAIRRLAQLAWTWAATSAQITMQENRHDGLIRSSENLSPPS